MLVPFERLVRPYQIREIRLGNGAFVQRRIPVAETEAEESITSVLEWTATTSAEEATIPEQQYGPPLDYTPDEEREVDREVVTRRVENPEDPAQYVEVEDASRITMRKEEDRIKEIGFTPVPFIKRTDDTATAIAEDAKSEGEKKYHFNIPEG